MLEQLLTKLDSLIALHKRNDDMWVDFFEGSKERILKDSAFGCEYLLTGWHGIGSYDDEKIFADERDEALRRELHPQVYKLATEIKNDQN